MATQWDPGNTTPFNPSPVHALATGGARVVATLVVGRVIDPTFNDESRALWDNAVTQPFSFDTFCLE